MERVWLKPKLVVLVRGKPEERVLDGCKDSVGAEASGTGGQTICQGGVIPGQPGWCYECYDYATS